MALCLGLSILLSITIIHTLPYRSIRPNTVVPILNQHSFQPPPWAEVSPTVVGTDVFVATNYSYQCTWTHQGIVCHKMVTHQQPNVPWRRTYAGVYGAVRVKGLFRKHLLQFVHGENANTIRDGVATHNSLTTDTTCWSGYVNGVWQDCWEDYFGFASVVRDNKDLGPIVWPADGYLKSDRHTKASNGIRHPTATVIDNFVYVFYCDTSPSVRGVAVARSPVKASGKPSSFQTWTAGGWRPSLPKGFNTRYIKDFYTQKGPQAQAVIPGSSWFAATKAPTGYVGLSYGWVGTNLFGTQEYRSSVPHHWWKVDQPLWTSSDYNSSTAQYPRPLTDHLAIAVNNGQIKLLSFGVLPKLPVSH